MSLTIKDVLIPDDYSWCIREGLMTVATGSYSDMHTLFSLIGDARFRDKIHVHKDIFLSWGELLENQNTFAEYSLCMVVKKK